MFSRVNCIFLALLCLGGFIVRSKGSDSRNNYDKESINPVVGSGGWALDISDDEDLVDSGSGSGSGMEESDTHEQKWTTHTLTTRVSIAPMMTERPLSDCESKRQTNKLARGKYTPRCLPNGDFDSLQCNGYPGKAECWCSDLLGREIPGTLMEAPNYPSCDDGTNLPPCIYQLVKHKRSKLLGSFQPRCAVDGQFEQIQCHGSMCFCVVEGTGTRVSGTEVNIPKLPKCGDDNGIIEDPDRDLPDPVKDSLDTDKTNKAQVSTPAVDVRIDEDAEDKSEETKNERDEFDEDNKTGKDEKKVLPATDKDGQHGEEVEKVNEIMSQPGILAGIIGGSVVLLLCLVLLIMFLIYRMRKKDEGSYPLDEPRKTPNYSYMPAPKKEFYA